MIEIRRLQSDTRNEQLQLFNKVFGLNATEEEWAYKHNLNPLTSKYYVYAALDGDKIVGINCFILMNYRFGEQILKAFQSCDTAVDPAYRGMGIFTKIVQKAVKDFEEEGADFVCGFPGTTSYPGFMKMEWIHMTDLQTMLLPLNLSRIIKNKFKIWVPSFVDYIIPRHINKQGKIPYDADVEVYDKLPFSVDDYQCFKRKKYIEFLKMKDHYEWWLGNIKKNFCIYVIRRDDKILAYMIVEEIKIENDRRGIIIDWDTAVSDDEEVVCLYSKILAKMNKKYDAVLVDVNTPSESEKIFNKLGFRQLKNRKYPFIIKVIRKENQEILLNKDNWQPKPVEIDIKLL